MKYEKRPWSTEERIILKKYYGSIPMIALQLLLPERTPKAIYSQVAYLKKRNWAFYGKESS